MAKGTWTYERCYELATSCTTRSEMKARSNWAYNLARKNGWLDDYTWFVYKKRKAANYWNNYDRCKQEAGKYTSRRSFYEKSPGAASYARKNGWINDFFGYLCKPKGYWNNYERCRELALKCKTRSEFHNLNSTAAKYSLKNGWIDSFDWLADDRIFNNKKVDSVYAYEFVDSNAVYIGRTLMRRQKERDKEHRLGYAILSNQRNTIYRDSVLLFAIANNCDIPPMTILEKNLTLQEGRDREDYWVNIYKNNGWHIINKAKTGINCGSLGSLNRGKWTYEACKEIALTCKSLSEYKLLNGSAYAASRINNWLKDYDWFIKTSDLISASIKAKPRKWTQQACYELALTCKTSYEFQKKSSRAYIASKEFGWFEEYTWFVNGFSLITPSKWTQEACMNIAKNCKTKTEFKKTSGSAYRSALTHGWLNDYKWFVDGNRIAGEQKRKYTYEKCHQIALQYNTKAEYKLANSTAYSVSRVNGWLKDYTWFVSGKKKGRKWTYENVQLEASRYLCKRDFINKSNIAYRKAKSNNWLQDLFTMTSFGFKGYFDIATFQLELNKSINFNEYKYINFSSTYTQQIVYNFYKEEMQQGERINSPNLGQKYIRQCGFYDIYPKRASWEKFKKEVCPIILYSFEIINNTIWLDPINIKENNNIFQYYNNQILKL